MSMTRPGTILDESGVRHCALRVNPRGFACLTCWDGLDFRMQVVPVSDAAGVKQMFDFRIPGWLVLCELRGRDDFSGGNHRYQGEAEFEPPTCMSCVVHYGALT